MEKSYFSNLLTRLPENNRLERIWLLAKMEFKRRYYGSVLGLLWAFINPLGRFAIYYYVFTYLLKSDTPNFALFLFLGLITWLYFAEGAVTGLTVIRSKSFILENIQINKLDIYYAALLSNSMGFSFNFVVYFIASLLFGVHLDWQILFLPLLILNVALFILGVMIFLSVIHIFVRDILHVWNLVSLMLMWFSGVFFELDKNSPDWKEAALVYLTPISGILINLRAVLIYNEKVDLSLFLYSYTYTLVFLGLAVYFLNRSFGVALEKQ